MDWAKHIKQLLELLLSENVKWAVAVISYILLIIPAHSLPHSLAQLAESYQAYIWLSAAFCTLLIILSPLGNLFTYCLQFLAHRRAERRVQQALHSLTEDEKTLLRQFTGQTKQLTSTFLDPYLESTQHLVDLGIIQPNGVIFLSSGYKQRFTITAAARKELYQRGKTNLLD